MKIPLTVENLLLRGSSLRNTHFVFGVAVFTGHDSKVMINNEKAKYKFSTLEKMTNYSIFVILGTQVILSIIGSLVGSTWTQLNSEYMGNTPECQDKDNTMDWCNYERAYYLFMDQGEERESGFPFPTKFGTWILIFTNLVPISLMVTSEMVKLFQAMFMSSDINMFDQE